MSRRRERNRDVVAGSNEEKILNFAVWIAVTHAADADAEDEPGVCLRLGIEIMWFVLGGGFGYGWASQKGVV